MSSQRGRSENYPEPRASRPELGSRREKQPLSALLQTTSITGAGYWSTSRSRLVRPVVGHPAPLRLAQAGPFNLIRLLLVSYINMPSLGRPGKIPLLPGAWQTSHIPTYSHPTYIHATDIHTTCPATRNTVQQFSSEQFKHNIIQVCSPRYPHECSQ